MLPPSGTSEDLLALLARGTYAPGRRPAGPLQSAWESAWILAGKALAALLALAPRAWDAWIQDRLFTVMAGGRRLPSDEASPALAQAAELARRAGLDTGSPPAFLCLLSHPPVSPGFLHLNVELTRQALAGLRRLAPRGRARVVNAVDLFAVDMLDSCERGVYAGFMGSSHLGIDRLPSLRSRPERSLLEAAAWPKAALRIARALSRGDGLAMVLGGGVPATGRIVYCAREFLHRLREERPEPRVAPKAARERLLASSEAFSAFHASLEVGGGTRRSAWRMMEAWLISILSRGEALAQAEEGALPAAALGALALCAQALGWSGEAMEAALGEFARDYACATSPRERLFRFLGRRIAAKGTPIVLLPLTHGRPGAVRMRFGEPVLLAGAAGSTLEVRDVSGASRGLPLRDFCRSFVRSRFP